MRAQKSVTLPVQEWATLEREAGRLGISHRIENLLNLGRVKERELRERDEKIRKKELFEIGKES